MFRFKLRSQLAIVSLVLLLLPWLGARYLQAVDGLLQQQHAYSMEAIAQATTVLVESQHGELLRRDQLLQRESVSRPIAAVAMISPIRIDGYQDDWLDYRPRLKNIPLNNQLGVGNQLDPQDLSARYVVVSQNNSVNVLLDVVDDSIVFRDPLQQDRHGVDGLALSLVDSQRRVHRYLLSSSSYGQLNVYEYIGNYLSPIILQHQPGIKAAWQSSAYGYRIELNIPNSMMTNEFSVAIIDYDKHETEAKVIGLGDVREYALFSRLLLPSTTLTNMLSKMATEGVRIWLVDNSENIFAMAGQGQILMEDQELESIFDLFYGFLLQAAQSDDESLSHQESVLSSDTLEQLLKKKMKVQKIISSKEGASVMMAAQPILIDGMVLGAVIVEQNTNAILGLKNEAVKSLFQTTALAFIAVIILLLGFASRLSFRIRRLNSDVAQIVSGDGRLSGKMATRIEHDELGELRQGFTLLLQRLGRYTDYLEALSSRLAHELRTPIAVIRTSLEHLEADPVDRHIYIKRASEGSERLNSIVTRMSEASRLEHTMSSEVSSPFDIRTLLTNLAPVYNDIYSEVTFEFSLGDHAIIINGAEGLLVQMLDKLLANAVDFHKVNTPIKVILRQENKQCTLRVRNSGISLPDTLEEQLFQPMVSVRNTSSSVPHLGLGLYIVKLVADFHHGDVVAENWSQGVEFCVSLPIKE
ncbi:MAG: hypothetical protein COA90_04760 [Gammaproteobacteria bacterium]|nr:MAG: hypothetical protein COA90_04760 [Gammaproteobacteria bacterium]